MESVEPIEVIKFKCPHCMSEYSTREKAELCAGIHVAPIGIKSYLFNPADLEERSMRIVGELVSVPDKIEVEFPSRNCPNETFTESYYRK